MSRIKQLHNRLLAWIRPKKPEPVKIAIPMKKEQKRERRKRKRNSGYRNWMNKRVWLPVVVGSIARLSDGTKYEIRRDGWRKITRKA